MFKRVSECLKKFVFCFFALVAQLDRASACGAGGRRFESYRARFYEGKRIFPSSLRCSSLIRVSKSRNEFEDFDDKYIDRFLMLRVNQKYLFSISLPDRFLLFPKISTTIFGIKYKVSKSRNKFGDFDDKYIDRFLMLRVSQRYLSPTSLLNLFALFSKISMTIFGIKYKVSKSRNKFGDFGTFFGN